MRIYLLKGDTVVSLSWMVIPPKSMLRTHKQLFLEMIESPDERFTILYTLSLFADSSKETPLSDSIL